MVARTLRLVVGSLERLVPPSVLAYIFWPFVAVVAFQRSVGNGGRSWRKKFAEAYGRPAGFLRTWRNFIDKTYMRLALRHSGRLGEPAWRKRFITTGLEGLSGCHAAGRPVVLAVIHTHHLTVLRLFVRAQGLPIASLASRAAANPSPGASPPGKFTLSQVRSAYAFLRSGRCLLIACDVPTEDAVNLPTELGTIRINVGPFRLAALANAVVVPATSWQEGPWRFHLAFGEPMTPPTQSADLAAFGPLAEHCLRTWRHVLRRHPEQHNVRRGVWNQPPDHAAKAPPQIPETQSPCPAVPGKR